MEVRGRGVTQNEAPISLIDKYRDVNQHKGLYWRRIFNYIASVSIRYIHF